MLHFLRNNTNDPDAMIVHLSTKMSVAGGEHQLLLLYQGLKEKNVPQIIICALGSQLEDICQKKNYLYIALRRRGCCSFLYAWELKKTLKNILKKQPIRVIHCHDAHAHTHMILTDILLLHRISLPLVISRKVVSVQRKPGMMTWKYRYPSIRKVVCVSEAVADVCRPWVAPDKMIVLHDTVNIREYIPPKKHEIFTIGIIGSLIFVKDHLLFLECAKIILNVHPAMRFWIIGEGDMRKQLEERAKELAIHSQVTFFGFREDIPELLSQLDVLMITSKNEGLCSTILQAMAAQVPVIAKNVGGIPEIIQSGENGLLAENQDDFVKYALTLYEDASYRQAIIEAAVQCVQAYDLPVYVKKIQEVYYST